MRIFLIISISLMLGIAGCGESSSSGTKDPKTDPDTDDDDPDTDDDKDPLKLLFKKWLHEEDTLPGVNIVEFSKEKLTITTDCATGGPLISVSVKAEITDEKISALESANSNNKDCDFDIPSNLVYFYEVEENELTLAQKEDMSDQVKLTPYNGLTK